MFNLGIPIDFGQELVGLFEGRIARPDEIVSESEASSDNAKETTSSQSGPMQGLTRYLCREC